MPAARDPLPQPSAMRRRTLLLALAGLPTAGSVAGLTAGCSDLDGPTVITLREADIAGLIERAFPIERRVLEVLDVALAAPTIQLLPDRNRLAVVLQLKSTELLFNRSLQGRVAFDSALRYEPSDASIRLTQVRVQSVGVGATTAATPTAPATPPADGSDALLRRLSLVLAEKVLDEMPIYKLNAERQAQLRRSGLEPTAVTVTSRGVEITIARRSP